MEGKSLLDPYKVSPLPGKSLGYRDVFTSQLLVCKPCVPLIIIVVHSFRLLSIYDHLTHKSTCPSRTSRSKNYVVNVYH